MKLIAILFIALNVVACSNGPVQPSAESKELLTTQPPQQDGQSPKVAVVYPRAGFKSMRFAQGPCHGYCPVYSFDISNAGTYVYNGERHVSVEGQQKGVLDQASLEHLVMHFSALQKLGLPAKIGKENCTLFATDHSYQEFQFISSSGNWQFRLDLGCHQFKGREAVLSHIEGIKAALPLRNLVSPADQ